MKVAKLVYVNLLVRVIVDEDATDDAIYDAARPRLIGAINDGSGNSIEDIVDDEECPYEDENDEYSTNGNPFQDWKAAYAKYEPASFATFNCLFDNV